MKSRAPFTKSVRVVITAALATSLSVALNTSGGQAALEYDTVTAGIGDLTRFEIDGDRVPGVASNSGITLNPGVNSDWESTPYGPQPIGSDPSQPAPAGIGSSGLLPLLFSEIKADDFPTVSPSPNPAFGLPGEPEFCVPNNEDAWVGGEKVQKVSIDNPLFNIDGDQALQCANVLSKGDLFSVYTAYETVAVPNVYGDPDQGTQNHVIVYGAWERAEVPGELNFYIPIADATAGNSSGDRLIAFDYDSSAPASYRILQWDGSGWAIESSGTAAVNGEVFAAAVGFADGSAFGSGGGEKPSFGEFALDITAAGILPEDSNGTCVELTTAGYVFTETGNSASAQLKDFVGAPKIPIGNCGPFSVTKAGPAGVINSPLFDYRVEQQDSLDIFDSVPATSPASTTNQLNSQFMIGDTQVWTGAFAEPDYFAFEDPAAITPPAPAALPTGWDLVSVECTYVDGYTTGYPIVTETLWTNGARTTDANGDLRVFQVQSDAFLTLTGHAGFVPNCVITNDAAGIVVTKAGTGDAVQEFDFDANDQTDSLAIGESTFFAFDASTPVTITEGTLPAGWELSSIECLNEDGSPNATGDVGTRDVDVIAGDTSNTIECTFTNNQLPMLTLIKDVTNDNGGTAVAGDWTLAAAGATGFSGPTGVSQPVSPGSYDLSESGPLLYTGSDWVCTAGQVDADTVAIGYGDDVTCTITNDDDAPSLTLVKEVINDNGGTAAPGDFTLTATGYSAANPQAGTYGLSETGPAGYTQTSLTCDNAQGQVTSVTLGLGEDVTCTFVNNDDAPSLTLVKEVVNDDGGHAVASDFTLSAAGATPISGAGGATSDASFSAGSYDLSETAVAGYTAGDWVCVGGTQDDADTVTLGVGESSTCTIVNDDEPVDLELTKNDDGVTVIAGGAPFDYTITVQNIGDRDVDLDEPVTMTDELPGGLSWESFPANCVQAGQTLTCDIDPALLPAGGTPIVITVTVSADADAVSGTYVNKASVTTEDDTTDNPPCPATSDNNVDCEETPVDREGAIQIIKTDDVANGVKVEPGEAYSYELVVTNIGVSTILPGLVVTDDLPAQLDLASVSGGAGWTCNNADPIECTYAPALAPGATAPAITVDVQVTLNAAGTDIVNVAEVIGAIDRDCETDRLIEAFDPACNEVTDDDDETTPLNPNADLAIVKTASADVVGAGGGFDWILDITNNGPGTAINVVIGDIVPSALAVTGVTSSDFACGNTGNDVECTVASLAAGASGTVTIQVTVPLAAESGTVDNVGAVESDTPDPDLTNNSDDASVAIVAQAAPTTTLPPVTLPPTGSDAPGGVVQAAFVLFALGAVIMVASRRRRDDEAELIA